jgi:hypothetical protein
VNNSQKNTSKVVALFLSLGLMSSLVGCDAGTPGEGEQGEDAGAPTEQPVEEQEEGGEGGEENEAVEEQPEGGEGGEGGEDG